MAVMSFRNRLAVFGGWSLWW